MEIGSIRPAYAGPVAPTLKAPVANEQAVPTELSGPAAVTDTRTSAGVADKEAKAGEDRARREADAGGKDDSAVIARRELERQVEIDPDTQALVFKKVDIQTGNVVEQVPEEAILRMRASIAAWGEGLTHGRSASFDVEA